MRKGDEKRQELLNTAERIFCQKGYEATSIQDILNVMNLSKGGFYHHFTGKEAVMSALCERHAALSAAAVQDAMLTSVTPMERINAVLHGYMPLRREEESFLSALLPYLARAESRTIALTYQDALLAHFLPLLQREVALGVKAGVLCPPVKDMERTILHLLDRSFLDAAAYLARVHSGEAAYDPNALLHLLERTRRAVEVLLDAPYGSVEILRVEEVDEVMQNAVCGMQS